MRPLVMEEGGGDFDVPFRLWDMLYNVLMEFTNEKYRDV